MFGIHTDIFIILTLHRGLRMEDDLTKLMNEAATLELNVSNLYLAFHELLERDSSFWWTLAMEEQNHAAVLKTAGAMKDAHLDIPRELLPDGIEEIRKANDRITAFEQAFRAEPDRTRAFNFAYDLENSAGELHYDTFMKSGNNSETARIFKQLNGDDVNHAERILQYMTEHGIPMDSKTE